MLLRKREDVGFLCQEEKEKYENYTCAKNDAQWNMSL